MSIIGNFETIIWLIITYFIKYYDTNNILIKYYGIIINLLSNEPNILNAIKHILYSY